MRQRRKRRQYLTGIDSVGPPTSKEKNYITNNTTNNNNDKNVDNEKKIQLNISRKEEKEKASRSFLKNAVDFEGKELSMPLLDADFRVRYILDDDEQDEGSFAAGADGGTITGSAAVLSVKDSPDGNPIFKVCCLLNE